MINKELLAEHAVFLDEIQSGNRNPVHKRLHVEDEDWTNSNLVGYDLDWAVLIRVNLSDSDMREISFNDALIGTCIIENAQLINATIIKTDASKINMSGSDLTGSNLMRTSFYNSLFRGTKLCNTKLLKTSFNGSDMTGADFSGADLNRVFLDGCILTDAVFTSAKGTPIISDTTSITVNDQELYGKDALAWIENRKRV